MNSKADTGFEQAPRRRINAPFSVWVALAVGLFVAASWLFEPILLSLYAQALIVVSLFLLVKPKWHKAMAIVLVVAVCLVLILMPNATYLTDRGSNSGVKHYLQNIRASMEDYAENNDGCYPVTYNQLQQSCYKAYVHHNPYRDRVHNELWRIAEQQQMHIADLLPEDVYMVMLDM